jgi:hypothetical protein
MDLIIDSSLNPVYEIQIIQYIVIKENESTRTLQVVEC